MDGYWGANASWDQHSLEWDFLFFFFYHLFVFKYGVSSHLLYCPCWKCVDVNRRVCVKLEMGWLGWLGWSFYTLVVASHGWTLNKNSLDRSKTFSLQFQDYYPVCEDVGCVCFCSCFGGSFSKQPCILVMLIRGSSKWCANLSRCIFPKPILLL